MNKDMTFIEAAKIFEDYAMRSTTRECRLRAAARVVLQEAMRQEAAIIKEVEDRR